MQVLLDIHRDAILYSDTNIAKTVAWVDGKKAAQLMIIAPYDSGTLGIPRWRENLRFAVALAGAIEERYPGLCRPIFFCSRVFSFFSPRILRRAADTNFRDWQKNCLLMGFGSTIAPLFAALNTASLT